MDLYNSSCHGYHLAAVYGSIGLVFILYLSSYVYVFVIIYVNVVILCNRVLWHITLDRRAGNAVYI